MLVREEIHIFQVFAVTWLSVSREQIFVGATRLNGEEKEHQQRKKL